MNRPTSAWLDAFMLIILLAVSAVITLTSVSLIVGDAANVVNDKALVETGRPTYEDMSYTVDDLLMAVTRFDLVYPIDTLKVTYDPNPSTSGEPFEKTIELHPNTAESMLSKETMCESIMALRDKNTTTAVAFYDYPLSFKQELDSDSNTYTYIVTITPPGVI